MLEIQNYSDELIEEIANAQRECLEEAKKSRSVTTKNLDECKLTLAEINDSFDSFEINGKKCEEIMSKCNELKVKMDLMISNLKKELLKNTPNELVYEEIKISDVFGSVSVR